MIDIIPAILPSSLEDLREKLSLMDGLAPLVQIDVADGKFVSSKTWPYTEGGPQEFTRITEEEEGLPFWHSIDFEMDLMVAEPEAIIENWIRAGVRRVIVHIESAKHFPELIDTLEARFRGPEHLEGSVELGVAFGIDTPNQLLEPFLGRVDFVQCMGIAEIGYQGQPFDERVIEKVRDLRERFPHMPLSVDGGVSMEVAPALIAAGATRLVVGSALFESADIEKTLKAFQALG